LSIYFFTCFSQFARKLTWHPEKIAIALAIFWCGTAAGGWGMRVRGRPRPSPLGKRRLAKWGRVAWPCWGGRGPLEGLVFGWGGQAAGWPCGGRGMARIWGCCGRTEGEEDEGKKRREREDDATHRAPISPQHPQTHTTTTHHNHTQRHTPPLPFTLSLTQSFALHGAVASPVWPGEGVGNGHQRGAPPP
jgi:hypothetical protein